MISCIFIACSKSDYHRQITNNAIASCGVDSLVVETFSKVPYKVRTLFWNTDFNYNACLNYGILNTDSEYIALCNNDLVFTKGWESIIETMKRYEVLSACPFSEYSSHRHGYKADGTVHFGYQVGSEMLGWCIVVHRDIFSIIGKLDETYSFWCSDNAYADQLQSHGLKHLLDCGSIVNHIRGESKTLNTLTRSQYHRYTIEQYNNYVTAKRNRA